MRSSRGASRGGGRSPGTRDWGGGALSFASLVVSVWLLSLQRSLLESVWKNLSPQKPHPLPPGLQSADVKSSIRISSAARNLPRSPSLCSRDPWPPLPHSDPGPFYPGKLYPDEGPGAGSLSEKQWGVAPAPPDGAKAQASASALPHPRRTPALEPGWAVVVRGPLGGRVGLQSADWETDFPAQAWARLCFRGAFCLCASPGVPEHSAV